MQQSVQHISFFPFRRPYSNVADFEMLQKPAIIVNRKRYICTELEQGARNFMSAKHSYNKLILVLQQTFEMKKKSKHFAIYWHENPFPVYTTMELISNFS